MQAQQGLQPDRRFDLTIFCDGSSYPRPARSNPTGGLGFTIYDRTGRQLLVGSAVVPDSDNNESELRALLTALQQSAELTSGRVLLYSDSQTAVDLLNHRRAGYTDELQGLVHEFDGLRRRFRKVVIRQIPRRFNQVADFLSRIRLKRFLSRLAGNRMVQDGRLSRGGTPPAADNTPSAPPAASD